VFTREWLEVDVAVADGYVAGLGEYEGHEAIDVRGKWLAPGFIDAHVHLESSKLLVDEFARLVLTLGTTAVVADPHEIANVLGTDGVHWLLDACSELESPRRPLSPGDLEGLLRRRRVLGLAEMMNFPGVISGDARELAKLALSGATHVDGHAPGVLDRALNAYVSAGIRSDHEARTEEGRSPRACRRRTRSSPPRSAPPPGTGSATSGRSRPATRRTCSSSATSSASSPSSC
jgi:adenine deaminase